MPLFLLALLPLFGADACTAPIAGHRATELGHGLVGQTSDCATCDSRVTYVPPKKWITGMRPVVRQNLAYPRYVGWDSAPMYWPVVQSNSTLVRTNLQLLGEKSADRSTLDPNGGGVVAQPAEDSTLVQQPSLLLGHVPADPTQTTYGFYEGYIGLINDAGLAMGESTCGAKLLSSPAKGALLSIYTLNLLAMERCATARCAITTMASLAEKYGFFGEDAGMAGGGETLNILDTEETWVFHVLSDGEKGAVWAAQKLPSTHFTVVANNFIIGEVDCADEENFM